MGLFDNLFGDFAADIKDVSSDLASIKDDVMSSITDLGNDAADLQNDITGETQQSDVNQDETLGGE